MVESDINGALYRSLDNRYSERILTEYEIEREEREDREEEEDEELPMALVVEDEEICQNFLQTQLKQMKIQTRCAASVNEAIAVYEELTKEGITVNVIFLDIYLKENSTGLQLLKIIKEKKWMERALIIVMSGNDDKDTIKECYKYKIQNFLIKPISKASFFNEKFKIKKHLENLKCPLPEYKIEKELGGGANGVVQLIKNNRTRELFALKTVTLDPNDKAKVKAQEGRLHKNLKSPTVLELIEYRLIDNNLYMVIEYAEHGTLSQHIKEKKDNEEKFSTELILDWITELFIGLFTIHEKRLMHRDIKADNLFICKNNVLKIGDFGIARASESGKAFTVCGTVSYMAPEMFLYKEYYKSVDIWAAGVVLYEMIMLKKPFEGSTEETQAKIQAGVYDPIPEKCDERLKKLIKYCLNLDPILRYSAAEILKLEFIAQRVRKLFSTKVLVNDDINSKLLDLLETKENFSIDLSSNIQNSTLQDGGVTSLSSIDPQKLRNYYLNFKLAFKIDSVALKSTYKPGYFSSVINNVIKGSDLELFVDENKISISEIEKLILDNFLVNIANPKSKDLDLSDMAFYQIKIYENERIDNSIMFSIATDGNTIEDPVQLSLECLSQAEYLYSKIKHSLEENTFEYEKADLFSSQYYVSFLYDIKKLKYLKLGQYKREEKLAIILNIYQVMYIHYLIKSFLFEDNVENSGLFESVKGLFRSSNKNVELTYEISNQILSLYEMKNIVIRRNSKPLNAYFRLASSSDPRIGFIQENFNIVTMMKLHIVCLDPIVNHSEEDLTYEPKFTQFMASNVFDQLDEHCKAWLNSFVKRDENQLNIPKFFKEYLVDFGNNEEEMIKSIYRILDDPSQKPSEITKLIKSKGLIINYC